MKTIGTQELVVKVNNLSSEILENLNDESLLVYSFLMSTFSKQEDVSKDALFQFVFRSFYGLDNAGLTPVFKEKYFLLMQEHREEKVVDPKPILEALWEIKNAKRQRSFQFSFTSKLINMINDRYPIYDAKVSKAIIGTNYCPSGSFEKKFRIYQDRHRRISEVYDEILHMGLLSQLLIAFDDKFKTEKLSQIKKLDFIFWTYGKLF